MEELKNMLRMLNILNEKIMAIRNAPAIELKFAGAERIYLDNLEGYEVLQKFLIDLWERERFDLLVRIDEQINNLNQEKIKYEN